MRLYKDLKALSHINNENLAKGPAILEDLDIPVQLASYVLQLTQKASLSGQPYFERRVGSLRSGFSNLLRNGEARQILDALEALGFENLLENSLKIHLTKAPFNLASRIEEQEVNDSRRRHTRFLTVKWSTAKGNVLKFGQPAKPPNRKAVP